MTEPHPALIDVVRSREAAPIQDEGLFLSSVLEHRMVSAVLSAHQQGAIALSSSSAMTLGVWDLDERRSHLCFWQTIFEVEKRLASIGARMAVLKGVATEARWYDRLGERACTDVDVLLDPAVLDSAADVVEALDPNRGSAAAIDWLVRRRLVQHVDLHVGETPVDLHFDPLKIGLPTRQLVEVWDSTQKLDTPQGTIRVLQPEIELVLLLLHLNKDRFAFLSPFLDIRHILARGDLDWDYVRGFVTNEGLDVPVWKSLEVVAQVLGIAVDIPRPAGVRAWTWDRLWGVNARLQGYEGRMQAPSVQPGIAMLAAGRTSEKARELRRRLLPPRPLLELAGNLEPPNSYIRYLAVDRFRSGSGIVAATEQTGTAAPHTPVASAER